MSDGDRTIGELARQIDGMRREQVAQMQALREQIHALVSAEYVGLLEKQLQDRIGTNREAIAKEEAERKAEINSLRGFLRYLVGILIAVAAILIPFVVNLRGP